MYVIIAATSWTTHFCQQWILVSGCGYTYLRIRWLKTTVAGCWSDIVMVGMVASGHARAVHRCLAQPQRQVAFRTRAGAASSYCATHVRVLAITMEAACQLDNQLKSRCSKTYQDLQYIQKYVSLNTPNHLDAPFGSLHHECWGPMSRLVRHRWTQTSAPRSPKCSTRLRRPPNAGSCWSHGLMVVPDFGTGAQTNHGNKAYKWA